MRKPYPLGPDCFRRSVSGSLYRPGSLRQEGATALLVESWSEGQLLCPSAEEDPSWSRGTILIVLDFYSGYMIIKPTW